MLRDNNFKSEATKPCQHWRSLTGPKRLSSLPLSSLWAASMQRFIFWHITDQFSNTCAGTLLAASQTERIKRKGKPCTGKAHNTTNCGRAKKENCLSSWFYCCVKILTVLMKDYGLDLNSAHQQHMMRHILPNFQTPAGGRGNQNAIRITLFAGSRGCTSCKKENLWRKFLKEKCRAQRRLHKFKYKIFLLFGSGMTSSQFNWFLSTFDFLWM